MRTTTRWARAALLLSVLALLATACRGGGGAEDTAEGEGSEDVAATDAATDSASATEDEGAAASPTEDEGGAASPTEDEGAAASPTEDEGAEPAGEVATDVGVTEEACPDAVNQDNGCIYLGTISDLTVGPFTALSTLLTQAQAAFWNRVNEEGGIGGYDINVSEYTRDNQYNPEVHSQVYEEIKDSVLALAQTLGSPTTAAIIEDLEAEGIVAAPGSWTSAWLFRDVILESGNAYCIEAMNGVEWALENRVQDAQTVMAVHFPGDYGADGAAGARVAAENAGLEFTAVETTPGADNQAGAISAVVSQQPDILVLTTSPTETGTIVGQAAAQGFTGTVVLDSPAYNKALLDSAAGQAIESQVVIAYPWPGFEYDSPGHEAMREALGDVDPNDGYVAGWAWSYPLRAALEAAAESGDLTRAGLLEAATSLESVDYEGMLPEGAGNFAGEPNDQAVRQTTIAVPDRESATGSTIEVDFYEGPSASEFELEGPCFESAG